MPNGVFCQVILAHIVILEKDSGWGAGGRARNGGRILSYAEKGLNVGLVSTFCIVFSPFLWDYFLKLLRQPSIAAKAYFEGA